MPLPPWVGNNSDVTSFLVSSIEQPITGTAWTRRRYDGRPAISPLEERFICLLFHALAPGASS